ncbi:MAG: 2-amino-4-hydroxy-6-hydroxymethyldihydropteridine diphosphokinase [Paramuribaculum sp.]|nr:2-amino-4-hydroxy-6-hydroxymethyldihydropteridine diphosphokinase [Paramuribaculum sp.]
MAEAHVNIGSNIGDRRAHIARAVAAIRGGLAAESGVRRSEYFESEAWGFESANRFLNLGITFEWDGTGEELLDFLLRIQQSICSDSHRNADGEYIDRKIDIDLIALGDSVCSTPRLTLPHPRMTEREFVLRPMAELMPEWRHPHNGLKAAEMLDGLLRRRLCGRGE